MARAGANLECMRMTTRVASAVFCLVAVGPGLTACGGQPAVCDDVDALQASVKKLEDVKVGENALSELQTDLAAIQSDIKQLSKDASDQYSSQVADVKSQATALKSSLQTASASPTAATLTRVRDDAKALGASVKDLGNAVADTC